MSPRWVLPLFLLVGCGAESPPSAGNPDPLQAARCAGRFVEAAALADSTVLGLPPDTSPSDRAAAERLRDYLRTVSTLAPEAQDALARADCLIADRDAAYDQRDYPRAVEICSEQAELLRTHYPGASLPLADALWYGGIAAYRASRWDDAERLLREGIAVTREVYPEGHPDLMQLTFLLAAPYQERGQYLEADALFRESLALQERYGGHRSNLLNNHAKLLQQQGDLAAAEVAQRESVELQRERGGRNLGLALQNLGSIQYELGHLEDATSTLEQAIRTQVEASEEEHPVLATPRLLLARLRIASGELDEAERLLRATLDPVGGWGPEHPNGTASWLELARIHRLRGDAGEEAALHNALALAERYYGDAHPRTVDALLHLARLAVRDDPDTAGRLLRRAVAGYEQARWQSGTGLTRATARIPSPYADLAAWYARRGDVAAAFEANERALGRTLAELLDASRVGGPDDAGGDLARQLAEREREVDALVAAAATGAGGEAANRLAEARQDLLDIRARWTAWHAEAARKRTGFGGEVVDVAGAAASLDPRQALVGWLDLEAGPEGPESWAWILRPDGGHAWVRLPAGSQHDDAFWTQLREDLAATRRSALGGLRFRDRTRDALRAVHAERISPLAEHLSDLDALCIVAQGSMVGIPVEALPGPDDQLLGDRFAVSYAPSASVRARLRARSSGAIRTALVLGDPPAWTDASTSRPLRAWDPATLAALPPLDDARVEAQRVAGMIPEATLLLGADASEDRIQSLWSQLAGFDALHLATHALVDDAQPGQSALVLSQADATPALDRILAGQPVYDGLLTAQEIMREWELDAELVTLSACQTGLGRRVRGEGYLGLAHAFFQSGARNLVVSLWSVQDEATRLLMENFYEGILTRDLSMTRALQRAKRIVRDTEENGDFPYRHPYHWAGFILLGAG